MGWATPGDTDLPQEIGMAPANSGRNLSETRWPTGVGTVVYPAKHRDFLMKEDGHHAKTSSLEGNAPLKTMHKEEFSPHLATENYKQRISH